jgi:integrase
MPRPNNGPRLVLKQPEGYAKAVYFIIWYERGERRERSTSTDDLEAAQDALAGHIGAKRPKREGPCDPAEYPIADALALYGAEKAAKNEDKGARAGHAIDALLGFWGGKNVAEINEHTTVGEESGYVTWRTAQWVQGIKAEEKMRRVVRDTARRELIVLRSAVQYAWKAKQIQYAPFVNIPPKSDANDVWMSPSFAAALVRSCRRAKTGHKHSVVKPYLPYYLLTMLYTGTRPGAALRLQWQPNLKGGDVDLANGVLYRAPRGQSKKNKKRQTPVPIPPRLLHLLRYVRRRTRQFVFERNGEPIKKLRRSFTTAVRDAVKNFPELDGVKITPHTARHTAATWMLQRGVETWDAAGYLGMTVETLEETYGHHSPAFMARAKNAFAKHPTGNTPATPVKRRQST